MTVGRLGITGLTLLVSLWLGCDSPDPLGPVHRPSIDPGGLSPAALEPSSSGSAVKVPSSTNAVAQSESRIDVSWQDRSSNETGFQVHRSSAGASGAFTLLGSTGAGSISYSDGGLDQSTQYCYKVRAFRTSGSKTSYSVFSNTACATTPAPPPPPTPIAPSSASAAPLSSTVIGISWIDNSTNESGFRLERSQDGGASWATVSTTSPDIRSTWDDGRTSDQQVCYRVVAFNGLGDSPASNTDCTAPPGGPTDLTATLLGSSGEVDLTWIDNSSVEDGYDVFAHDGFGSYVRIVSLPPDATSFHAWSASDSYVVHATRDGGVSDPSNVATTVCAGAECPSFCTGDFDCGLGYVCGSGVCVPHCGDGILNRDETDVDCGGNSCGGCAAGQHCGVDADCASGICGVDSTCQP